MGSTEVTGRSGVAAVRRPPPVRAGTALSGRERELSELAEAAASTWSQRRGGLVFVEGAPGAGKSALVAAFVESAACAQAVVLRGSSSAEGTRLAFEPFVVALNRYADDADPEHLRRQLGELAPTLSRLVPNLGALVTTPLPKVAPDDLDMIGSAARLRRCLVEAFGRLARDRLVVAVLEDLHWAGAATLQVLDELLAAAAGWPLLVVVTTRDGHGDEAGLRRLVESREGRAGVARLSLGGLDPGATRLVAERVAGQKLRAALVERLAEVTEGNPLFVSEYVRHLVEHDALGIGWEHLVVPASVHAVIAERTTGIADRSRKALQAAAVLGRDFSLDLWRAVSGLELSELQAALDDGMRATVIERLADDVYSFTHALIADSFTTELTAVRRKRLHREVAVALEARFGDDAVDHAAELAHHFARGGGTVRDRALLYSAVAGQQAMLIGDFASAQGHFGAALEMVVLLPADRNRDVWELKLRMGVAGSQMATQGYLASSVDDEMPRIVELLDALADEPELILTSISIIGARCTARADLSGAADLFGRGAALAASMDLPGDVVMHQAFLLPNLMSAVRFDDALRVMAQSAPLVAGGVPTTRHWSGNGNSSLPPVLFRSFAQYVAWFSGRFAQAFELHAAAVTGLDAMRPTNRVFPLGANAVFSVFIDRAGEALTLSEQAIDLGLDFGQRQHVQLARAVHGRARVMLGDAGGLVELEQGLDGWRATGARYVLPVMLGWCAEARLAAGSPRDAVRALDEADSVVAATGQILDIPELRRVRGKVAEAAARRGEAGAWAAALEQQRAAWSAAGSTGNAASGVRVAVDLARLLARSGGTAEAVDVLGQAIDRCRFPGTSPDLERARAALGELTG